MELRTREGLGVLRCLVWHAIASHPGETWPSSGLAFSAKLTTYLSTLQDEQ